MPIDEIPMGEDPESKLMATILTKSDLKLGEARSKILLYLFDHRDRVVSRNEIIEKALKATVTVALWDSVRERIKDLRSVLRKFELSTDTLLVCKLPKGVRQEGYKLKFEQRNPESITVAFWKPHILERDVYIVYVEQLIYQNWPRRYSLRDPELNADSDEVALEQFKVKYANKAGNELRVSHPDELSIAHSYVAYGEVLARDRFLQWFDEEASMGLETAVTWRMDKKKVYDSSAILLGDPRSNSMMVEMLKDYGPLDMNLEVVKGKNGYLGRAHVRKADESELSRTATMNRIDQHDGYVINYEPRSGTVLTLVTRIRNRKTGKPLTIFCSEVARSMEQLAHRFTDDTWLRKMVDDLGWGHRVPEEFQILFLFNFGSLSESHLRCDPEIVASRPHIV